MGLTERIDSMGWTPTGEAKAIYDDFMENPDYAPNEKINKLLICLFYEREYESAAQLAVGMINNNPIISGDNFNAYFFYALASDMMGDRESAVRAYGKIITLNEIPVWTYSQLDISYTSKEFIEYLMEHSYSPEKLKNFIFKNPFEYVLQREMAAAKSQRFNVYYYPNEFTETEILQIVGQREKAYRDISAFLNTNVDLKVDLYLFNDAETKKAKTGHTGAGWAFGTVMVEVYNDRIKCHPYHELVHVLTDNIFGPTVSFLSEGLAVYVSEKCHNRDFGDYVNYDTHNKVLGFHKTGELFPLDELFTFEIGNTVSKPGISYPQAASLIKYFYETLGAERFFGLYRAMKPEYSREGIAKNISELEKCFGKGLDGIYNDWLTAVL
jgi:tetratricopeptide (TPR) repeat protein